MKTDVFPKFPKVKIVECKSFPSKPSTSLDSTTQDSVKGHVQRCNIPEHAHTDILQNHIIKLNQRINELEANALELAKEKVVLKDNLAAVSNVV